MASILGFLRHLRVRFLISFCRLLQRLLAPIPKARPDAVLKIPARDKNRAIKVHVYHSPDSEGAEVSGPRPVLVNFYGSGFAMRLHGLDDGFCRYVANNAGYVVLDVEYRVGPEHPFPASVHDVEDAVKYVLGRPKEYKTSQISVSGFSSGGNLALVAPTLFPAGTFQSLIAFYPSTNLSVDPSLRKMAVSGVKPRSSYWTRIFREGYIRDMDPRDPRISPAFADTTNYPAQMLVLTGEQDTSAIEAEELAERARVEGRASGRNVVIRRMKGCGHGFDKRIKTPEQKQAKDEAYGLAIDLLNKVADSTS